MILRERIYWGSFPNFSLAPASHPLSISFSAMCDQDFIDTLQLCDSQGDVSFESYWRLSERSYSLYCPQAALIQTVTPPVRVPRVALIHHHIL